MAHPYRIGDLADAAPARRAALPVAGRATTPRRRPRSAPPPSTAGSAAHFLGAQRDWRSPTGLPHRAPPPSAHRPAAISPPCRARPRRSAHRRATAARPGGRARRRPRAALDVGPGQPRHHHPRPGRQRLARDQRSQRQLGQAGGAGGRRRRRHHHHGPVAGRERPAPPRRLEVQRARPRRPRPASPGAAPPARAASRSAAAAARDRAAGRPIPTRAADRCRSPARTDRAVSARITASRSRPRSPTPGASPLPSGGRPFDGR